MSNKNDPNFNLAYEWPLGYNGWNTENDINLKKIGGLIFLEVVSKTETTPPSIVNGNRYLIPAGATGVWSGKTDQIAIAIDSAWEYYTPKNGWNLVVADEDNKPLTYSQALGGWQDTSVDVSGYVQESDDPTWTGNHTFNNPIVVAVPTNPIHVARQSTVTDDIAAIPYTNLGDGADVFKELDAGSGEVRFKTLKAVAGVSIQENANDITLSATGGGTEGVAILEGDNIFDGLNNFDTSTSGFFGVGDSADPSIVDPTYGMYITDQSFLLGAEEVQLGGNLGVSCGAGYGYGHDLTSISIGRTSLAPAGDITVFNDVGNINLNTATGFAALLNGSEVASIETGEDINGKWTVFYNSEGDQLVTIQVCDVITSSGGTLTHTFPIGWADPFDPATDANVDDAFTLGDDDTGGFTDGVDTSAQQISFSNGGKYEGLGTADWDGAEIDLSSQGAGRYISLTYVDADTFDYTLNGGALDADVVTVCASPNESEIDFTNSAYIIADITALRVKVGDGRQPSGYGQVKGSAGVMVWNPTVDAELDTFDYYATDTIALLDATASMIFIGVI